MYVCVEACTPLSDQCVHIQYSYTEVSIPCVHWCSRKATTTVSRFDSNEICSKWAHPSADACGDKGDDEEKEGEEEDEERQWGGAGAGLLGEEPHSEIWRPWHFHALLHVLLSFLDAAAWRLELSLVLVHSSAIILNKFWHLEARLF